MSDTELDHITVKDATPPSNVYGKAIVDAAHYGITRAEASRVLRKDKPDWMCNAHVLFASPRKETLVQVSTVPDCDVPWATVRQYIHEKLLSVGALSLNPASKSDHESDPLLTMLRQLVNELPESYEIEYTRLVLKPPHS